MLDYDWGHLQHVALDRGAFPVCRCGVGGAEGALAARDATKKRLCNFDRLKGPSRKDSGWWVCE